MTVPAGPPVDGSAATGRFTTGPSPAALPAPVTVGSRQATLRCLALDVLARRTVDVLRAHDIDCLLLKGPGLAARLYPDDSSARVYTDVDILVAPSRFDSACRALISQGFRWRLQGVGDGEFPWHEAPLAAPPGLVGSVDLHRGFAGVTSPDEFFRLLGAERETMSIAGSAVEIPGPIGMTLLALLHAAAPGRARHPLVDLERANLLMDDSTWTTAVQWGRSVGAVAAVAAAIDLLPPARAVQLSELLGHADTAVPAHLWLAGRQRPRVSVNLARVLHEQSGPRAIARQIVCRVFPSPAFVALWDPRARQGSRGLAMAYGSRLRRTVTGAPRALWDLSRAHHGGAQITTSHRRGRDRLAPRRWAAAAWALWSAAVLYRRLRRQPLAEIRVPRPFLAARNRDRRAIRRALLIARVPCLPTALIWQEWRGRLGCAPDVVVGVRRDGGGTVRAHAWLDGEDPAGDFTPLHRRPWPGAADSMPTWVR